MDEVGVAEALGPRKTNPPFDCFVTARLPVIATASDGTPPWSAMSQLRGALETNLPVRPTPAMVFSNRTGSRAMNREPVRSAVK